jgi:hypothetical protein
MNQVQIAHTSGWVAFVALSVALCSGFVMALPYHVKRKHSLGWHRTWTVVAVVAIGVHVSAQVRLDLFTVQVIAGWIALVVLLAASTHRGPHKMLGVIAFSLGLFHTLALAHHERGPWSVWGTLGSAFVATWLLGARHTPQATPRHTALHVPTLYRYSTQDGTITALTKWGLRSKLRKSTTIKEK